MKVCIISKYPPIEGGVSSETYWLAKALGEKGHEVFVITNAWEVEKDYREDISKEDLKDFEPKNVTVYSTVKDFKSPILEADYYSEKLISLAMDVVRSEDVDVIYSHYVLPYGIVGFVTKCVTKKPHIIRHAGSDIGRLYQSRFLRTVFLEAFKDADKIIGGENIFKVFKSEGLNTGKIVRVGYGVNHQYFNPSVKGFDLSAYTKKFDLPVFAYFGKVSQLKKTYAFVDAASKIKDKKFTLLFVVGDGDKVVELKKYLLSAGLMDRCVFLPFQPPWKIPSIMRASTCVVSPESEETPFLQKGSHYPKVVREAMACGKCVILGKGVAEKGLYKELVDGENALIMDPNDINGFKSKLEYVVDNPLVIERIGRNAYKFSKEKEDFDSYISNVEMVMNSVVDD